MNSLRPLVFLCVTVTAAGADDAQILQRAAKSVDLLQRVAAEWKIPCVSCHHQALPMIALEAARAHGVPVREDLARGAAEQALRPFSDLDAAARIDILIDPALSSGYFLRAASAAGLAPNLSTALYARQIARMQQPDGHWATLDMRPPHSAGLFAPTAMAVRAIDLALPASQAAEKQARFSRARRWLQTAQPESTEDLTHRLLGLQWAGASPAELRTAAQGLMALQKRDGGWSQTPSMAESDAYATAQSLAALRQTGMIERSAPAFQRGLEWLLKTQAADGSWRVKSRIQTPAPVSPPYFESGFPYGHDQWVSSAATAWAVMALSEALPPAKKPAVPLPVRGAAPETEPWMETAAFGPVSEVAKLDPNRATPGGTTALMFASDSAAKVRALLAKGANVKLVTKTGYDALMTASLYGGNRETLELLLKAGAAAKPRQKPRFNATALNLAIFTGDARMVEFLLANGADANHAFLMIGQFPAPPVSIAAQMDYPELLRVLAKRGAKFDAVDEVGMTPLGWSALGHKDASVRALLELGARPGTKDKFGLTAIEHTKGIQHCSGETARLLQARK
jgi:hypothetical protein